MVRKLFSLFFAGLILFNLFGYYFVFKCDQIQVKSEMKGMLRSKAILDHTVEITVCDPASNPEFTMIDKDEFRYRGMLYDILSIRVSGTSLIFRCINDSREEQLIARYDKYSTLVSGMNLPEKSRNSQAMLYHIIKHALVTRMSIRPPSASAVVLFYYPVSEFKSISIQPSFPPPWTA